MGKLLNFNRNIKEELLDDFVCENRKIDNNDITRIEIDGTITRQKNLWFDKDEIKDRKSILEKFGFDFEDVELLDCRFSECKEEIQTNQENNECFNCKVKLKSKNIEVLLNASYGDIYKESLESKNMIARKISKIMCDKANLGLADNEYNGDYEVNDVIFVERKLKRSRIK
jgi:hypothetical protein